MGWVKRRPSPVIRVGLYRLNVFWSSTSRNVPRTGSSLRSRHSPSSLSIHTGNRRTGSRGIRTPYSPRRLFRRSEGLRYFPCRRRRTSTNSRPKFPPRRERFDDSERCFAARHPPLLHWLMRMLRSPVTAISRQPPVPVPLCFAGFASNPAWHASFRFLPYFRGSFSLNRDRMSQGILRGGMGRKQATEGIWNYTFCLCQFKSGDVRPNIVSGLDLTCRTAWKLLRTEAEPRAARPLAAILAADIVALTVRM
jgi:hypothetical protein